MTYTFSRVLKKPECCIYLDIFFIACDKPCCTGIFSERKVAIIHLSFAADVFRKVLKYSNMRFLREQKINFCLV